MGLWISLDGTVARLSVFLMLWVFERHTAWNAIGMIIAMFRSRCPRDGHKVGWPRTFTFSTRLNLPSSLRLERLLPAALRILAVFGVQLLDRVRMLLGVWLAPEYRRLPLHKLLLCQIFSLSAPIQPDHCCSASSSQLCHVLKYPAIFTPI
jgi:hypothetical protein